MSLLIKKFLSAMEERDLIKAKSFLAEDFQMEFPGGEIFTELSELVGAKNVINP